MKKPKSRYQQRMIDGIDALNQIEQSLLDRCQILPMCIARYTVFGDMSCENLGTIRDFGLGKIAGASELPPADHLIMLAFHITSKARATFMVLAHEYKTNKKRNNLALSQAITTLGYAMSLVDLGDACFTNKEEVPAKTKAELNKELN